MRFPPPAQPVRLRRRRSSSTLVVLGASILALLSVVHGAPDAHAATGTRTSALNRSDNPRVAHSLRGYSIQQGGKWLKRVRVDHVSASWAARVVSTGHVTRIREPREAVTPGQRWLFASDVQAPGSATAQVTVSWYTASGRFLSWSGGPANGSVNLRRWTRVAAALRVPAGAAVAETVVNVAHTQAGRRVRVTQHDVRAPRPASKPTPVPTTAKSMRPPAGSTLVRDLSRAGSWTSENGGSLKQLAIKGPGGDPVLRSTLFDGQTGASGSVPSERNDLKGGAVPLGSVRWMVWHERFIKMPSTKLDSWQLIGPNEIHGYTLSQATVMPQVGADGRRRLNANAGRPAARNFDLGRIVLGRWHRYKMGIHYTNKSTGWLELWRDGVRVVRLKGPTTTEARDGYWKFGHYRNAKINGTSVFDVSGVRIYRP